MSNPPPVLPPASIPTCTIVEGFDEEEPIVDASNTTNHVSPSSSSTGATSVTLRLTAQEAQLFDILREVAASRQLEVRIAGGWVRDKILGLQTHDVDVAIHECTGVQFAWAVHEYLHSQGISASRIGIIAANPAQSKHLETATMNVLGIDVDFANLRGQEVYQEDSRIPIVQFGSPLDDAMRRDFTINALFYNLNTSLLEDWTGRGLRDLQQGVLETPLEPVQTFKDDPLRVLRAIRFAVRYNFKLDPALKAAAQMPVIHKALHAKVSRERVGKELEGMISGKGANPVAALLLISELKLAGSVFCIPLPGKDKVGAVWGRIVDMDYIGNEEDTDHIRHIRERGWECSMKVILKLPPLLQIFEAVTSAAGSINHRILPLAVFLLPFHSLKYSELRKSGKEFLAVNYVFRDGIKFKNSDVNAVVTMVGSLEKMVVLLDNADRNRILNVSPVISRLEAGLLLRECKECWVSTLLLASIWRSFTESNKNNAPVDGYQRVLDVYQTIMAMGLNGCWNVKPLMDGQAVIKALDLPRGPVVGTYLEEQVRWMLMNPDGSRDECEAHLLSLKRQLEGQAAEQNEQTMGVWDGAGKVTSESNHSKHVSKRFHVEENTR